MWVYCLRGQLDGRYLPLSDHHVRGFSIIGEAERCMNLLQQLYMSNPSEFQLGSISNLFLWLWDQRYFLRTFANFDVPF